MTNVKPLPPGTDPLNFWDPNSLVNPFSPNNPGNPLNPNSPLSTPFSQGIASGLGAIGSAVADPFGLKNVNSFFGVIGRPDFWIRAGIIVAGIGMVIAGVIVLVSSSKLVGDALTAAGKATKLTPVGAATNVATEALT